MSPSKPSLQAWGIAIGYAAFAYLLHTYGAANGFYPRFFWFQMVTHFVSASALALLLLRAGQTASLSRPTLLVFVVAGAAAGALAWELVEYLGIFPSLHWWGIRDSLLDLVVDVVGVTAVVVRHRNGETPVSGTPTTAPRPESVTDD